MCLRSQSGTQGQGFEATGGAQNDGNVGDMGIVVDVVLVL